MLPPAGFLVTNSIKGKRKESRIEKKKREKEPDKADTQQRGTCSASAAGTESAWAGHFHWQELMKNEYAQNTKTSFEEGGTAGSSQKFQPNICTEKQPERGVGWLTVQRSCCSWCVCRHSKPSEAVRWSNSALSLRSTRALQVHSRPWVQEAVWPMAPQHAGQHTLPAQRRL